MKIKFVYFDIGGVLINYYDFFQTASTLHGVRHKDMIKLFDNIEHRYTLGKATPEDFWQECIEEFKITPKKNFNFLKSWVADYKTIRETYNFIYKIKDKYKIGIISNIYHGIFELLIENKMIPTIKYGAVIESCKVGFRKPDKDIFDIATKKAGVNPNEILFVDDRLDFIEGAKTHGWNTFQFDPLNPKLSIDRLSKILK